MEGSGNYLVDRMDREDVGGRLAGVVMLCRECGFEICRCEEYRKEREEELKAYQENGEDVMTIKEDRSGIKESRVVEFTGIFRREYEMMRAHGMKIHGARIKATDALSFEVRKACRKCPQEKSAIIDCKLEVMAKIDDIIADVEKGDENVA